MYRIDRAREMCAQIGLGDSIMMYKDSQNRVQADVLGCGRGFARDLAVF